MLLGIHGLGFAVPGTLAMVLTRSAHAYKRQCTPPRVKFLLPLSLLSGKTLVTQLISEVICPSHDQPSFTYDSHFRFFSHYHTIKIEDNLALTEP